MGVAMRIMVIFSEYPPGEGERRREAVLRCASPGTQLDFAVIPTTFFSETRISSEAAALAAAPLAAEVARRAEADGFDAVVPFGTLDIGVELSRNLVRITVVGAGQATMHFATQLSRRLGLIVYSDDSIPFKRKCLQVWGFEDSVVGIRGIDVPLFESAEKSASMLERLVAVSRRLMDENGAELIIPMGVTMVPVHVPAAALAAEIGVPVLDALATSIQTAEMMVRVGVSHSPRTYPPPKSQKKA
jgi:allantoin racemase